MVRKLALFFILSLILFPFVTSLYCEECSEGCEIINGETICKENIIETNTASNFILPAGIIVLIIVTALIIYFKVLKCKPKY